VPTAADEGHLVLAFKNVIHRETTEKPDHKQLIEEVIEQVTGRAYKLVTCMQNEWKRLEESSAGREQAAAGHVDQDEHVRQALEWFGEDLVEIRD
jgi:DNA polymerase-3 subunit gamma/tau